MSDAELIGIRAFAREVGVSHAAVQKAIDDGRITAVVRAPNGRKLIRTPALDQWRASRIPQNNNRFGELDSDLEAGDYDEFEDIPDPGEGCVNWGERYTMERALLTEKQKIKLTRELDEVEGRLHRAEDVEAVWADVLIRFKTRTLGIPTTAVPRIASIAKLSRAQTTRVKELLEELVRDALIELAGYDKAKIQNQRAKRAARARSGSS
jgi:hypothetical protein